MIETKRQHYFLIGNVIYAVEVVIRDSGTVTSFCRVPNTKRLIKECADKDEAARDLQCLLQQTKQDSCSVNAAKA
ncbi:MAG: hypothetical protein HQL05_04980 [Nitrospirae bacterium]|uniref:hypothetical protein n=1 Tax=Candidatus Magnetobacterium casense TaxID=1455061 RepID=UPI00058CAEE6|nr:hypothetical protein [Candidatus Magnetobacterium casensis]MBF0337167.1 hypothetical protein [Nitrospirota bacterium]